MGSSLTEYPENEANIISFTSPLGKRAREMLDSFSEVWWLVETFEPDKKIDLFENIRLHDLGILNVPLEGLGKKVSSIVESHKVPFMLSYAHLATLFALKELKDVKLVVFDAHADCWDNYIDEKIKDYDFLEGREVSPTVNSATWLRNYAQEKGGENIFVIGLRSFSEDEMEFMDGKKISYVTSNDMKNRMSVVKSALWNFTEGSNVYLSLDIDVFDPSVAPGVHYPEPNGILFSDFQQIMENFNGQLVGLDLVSLVPTKEKILEFLAARCVKEILSKVKA